MKTLSKGVSGEKQERRLNSPSGRFMATVLDPLPQHRLRRCHRESTAQGCAHEKYPVFHFDPSLIDFLLRSSPLLAGSYIEKSCYDYSVSD
ncbi:hypothetical protein J2738_002856 [Variovorax paradoxus]|uniref:Uncharacterized protein n=1 Tax=Variovorax paradoxus TaxID=34073 RepID=A0AAE3XW83_VARPD|nr:hypothetical protein [Variovorax paradoxus]